MTLEMPLVYSCWLLFKLLHFLFYTKIQDLPGFCYKKKVITIFFIITFPMFTILLSICSILCQFMSIIENLLSIGHRIRQGEPGLPAIFDQPWVSNWVDSCFTRNVFGSSQLHVCNITSMKRAAQAPLKLRKATRLVNVRCSART